MSYIGQGLFLQKMFKDSMTLLNGGAVKITIYVYL